MDIIFFFETVLILFNLFFLTKNLFNKSKVKKEGSFHSIYNFSTSFFSSIILCLILFIYVIFSKNDFTSLTKILAIILIILLFISCFANAHILFGYKSFLYTYYSTKYTTINEVLIKNKKNKRLVSFLLNNKKKLSFITSKNNSSILIEILNRKSIPIKKETSS